MSGLAQRAVTAVIFVVVMVGGIYGGVYTFSVLFLAVLVLCLWEFFTMMLNDFPQNSVRRWIGVLVGMFPFCYTTYGLLYGGLAPFSFQWYVLFFSFLTILFFLVFIYELFAGSKHPFRNIGTMLTGTIYIGFPLAFLVVVATFQGEYHPNLIFGMLWLVWTNDTAAYLIGSQIGKHPLFPSISPKKTWEGTMAGLVFTMLMGYALGLMFDDVATTTWVGIAAVVAIFGALGDLVESMLKRSVGVKDSGTLLPGHGGFLDRFDAFIFMIPFVWLVLFLCYLP